MFSERYWGLNVQLWSWFMGLENWINNTYAYVTGSNLFTQDVFLYLVSNNGQIWKSRERVQETWLPVQADLFSNTPLQKFKDSLSCCTCSGFVFNVPRWVDLSVVLCILTHNILKQRILKFDVNSENSLCQFSVWSLLISLGTSRQFYPKKGMIHVPILCPFCWPLPKLRSSGVLSFILKGRQEDVSYILSHFTRFMLLQLDWY